jgi:hypothetical protein
MCLYVDDGWPGKDYYIDPIDGTCPDLIKNAKESLLKIIKDPETT